MITASWRTDWLGQHQLLLGLWGLDFCQKFISEGKFDCAGSFPSQCQTAEIRASFHLHIWKGEVNRSNLEWEYAPIITVITCTFGSFTLNPKQLNPMTRQGPPSLPWDLVVRSCNNERVNSAPMVPCSICWAAWVSSTDFLANFDEKWLKMLNLAADWTRLRLILNYSTKGRMKCFGGIYAHGQMGGKWLIDAV